MTVDHHCPAHDMQALICHYLTSNDGGYANDPADVAAWIAAILTGREGVVCRGAWLIREQITVAPTSGLAPTIRGYGPGVSTLMIQAPADYTGAGLKLVGCGNAMVRDLSVYIAGGQVTYGLEFNGGDRNHLDRVEVSGGECTQGTVGFVGSGDADIARSFIRNSNRALAAPALHCVNSAGLSISDSEIHQFLNGCDTIRLENFSRLSLHGENRIGSNVAPDANYPDGQVCGRAWFATHGVCSNIRIDGTTVVFSDNGNPPDYVIWSESGSLNHVRVGASAIVQAARLGVFGGYGTLTNYVLES